MSEVRAVFAGPGIASQERRVVGEYSPDERFLEGMDLGTDTVVADVVEDKAGCRVEGIEERS